MNTADRIVDTAEALIQQRGYHGFSFQDLADEIGIKKPSLYYHFRSKAALGQAVVQRHRARMREAAESISFGSDLDHWQALDDYLGPILEFGRTPEMACLCGVLGGEYLWLPEDMKAEVEAFFAEHLAFLARLLEHGRAAGTFEFPGTAEAFAKLVFAAVEGALLIKRTNGDTDFLDEIAGTVAQILGR